MVAHAPRRVAGWTRADGGEQGGDPVSPARTAQDDRTGSGDEGHMVTPPQDHALRFAIIGAGMSGILAAIKLTEAGFTDFTIYEKADRLGGTWRENTYPGISCDVPSHLYSYSFALTPEWSRRYSPGAEINAYFERVAHDHGLESQLRFGEEISRCEFVDGRWHLETATGHHDDVDVVIAATGVLHHPNIPDLEGLDRFEGAAFHSSRWNHDVPLEGARVGVIGTGSDRGPDRGRARRGGREAVAVPADRAVGGPAGEPGLRGRRAVRSSDGTRPCSPTSTRSCRASSGSSPGRSWTPTRPR